MTIASATSRRQYDGDGTTQTFPVPFYFLDNSHLQVVLTSVASVDTVQTITTNYTVNGSGNPNGGTVTMFVAPASGEKLTIIRSVPLTQSADLVDNDPLPAEVLETAFDKGIMIDQQIQEQLDRTIKVPVGAGSGTLPAPQANTLIGWNGTATGLQNYSPASQVTESSNVNFLQAGTGAVARTVQSKDRELLSVTDFFSSAQLTDYTTNAEALDLSVPVQAAINQAAASKRTLAWPPGTASVNNITLPSDLTMVGMATYPAIIKRRNSSAGNSFLSATSASRVSLRYLTIDGNKAGQTNGAHNLSFSGCESVTVENCRIINAKAAAGYGGGIALVDGSHDTSVVPCSIRNNIISGCDDAGVYVSKESYLSVTDNLIKGCASGVIAINFVFPPLSYVQNFMVISRNICESNTTAGVRFVGFYTGGTALLPIEGFASPPARGIVISDNICRLNGQYGIAFQGYGATITGNYVERNGTTGADGGILVNAWGVACNSNIVQDNAFFGIDGGGSVSCTFNNNIISYQGASSGLGAIGLNIGAVIDCQACHNVMENNGASGATSIYASGWEFGGSYFDQLGSRLMVAYNQIKLGNSVAIGIKFANGMDNVLLAGNQVAGGAANQAFQLQGGQNNFSVKAYGNIDWTNGAVIYSVASAATTVLPDVGDDFFITGTTGITSIRTYSSDALNQKVRHVQITSGGSGYNPASPPTVSFTGGGGVGAAGTALVSNSGAVIGVNMTNGGSGYTSAPTVGFSSGAAAGTARVGCDNFQGRQIALRFTGGVLTVTNGNNLILNGNFTSGAGGASILVLCGAFGNWYEISRRV